MNSDEACILEVSDRKQSSVHNDAVLWIFAFHFRKQMYLYPVPIKVLAAQRFHSDNPVHTQLPVNQWYLDNANNT